MGDYQNKNSCLECGVSLFGRHWHTKRCAPCKREFNRKNAKAYNLAHPYHEKYESIRTTKCLTCGDDITSRGSAAKFCETCARARHLAQATQSFDRNVGMKKDNLVRRAVRRGGGAYYAVNCTQAMDDKFIEAAKLLKTKPECIVAGVLSSFLNTYKATLTELVRSARLTTKH